MILLVGWIDGVPVETFSLWFCLSSVRLMVGQLVVRHLCSHHQLINTEPKR